jgi:hypothetical protein
VLKYYLLFLGPYFLPTLNMNGVPIIVGRNQNNKIGNSFNTGILGTFTTKVAVTM